MCSAESLQYKLHTDVMKLYCFIADDIRHSLPVWLVCWLIRLPGCFWRWVSGSWTPPHSRCPSPAGYTAGRPRKPPLAALRPCLTQWQVGNYFFFSPFLNFGADLSCQLKQWTWPRHSRNIKRRRFHRLVWYLSWGSARCCLWWSSFSPRWTHTGSVWPSPS